MSKFNHKSVTDRDFEPRKGEEFDPMNAIDLAMESYDDQRESENACSAKNLNRHAKKLRNVFTDEYGMICDPTDGKWVEC